MLFLTLARAAALDCEIPCAINGSPLSGAKCVFFLSDFMPGGMSGPWMACPCGGGEGSTLSQWIWTACCPSQLSQLFLAACLCIQVLVFQVPDFDWHHRGCFLYS